MDLLMYHSLRAGARIKLGDTADVWHNGEEVTVTIDRLDADGAISATTPRGSRVTYPDREAFIDAVGDV